jgi:ribonuclease Z
MPRSELAAEQMLVNGSTGDPVLYVDYPDADDALLFDAGDNAALPMQKLADLTAVFVTHHHVDHFIGLDRIVRANIDSDKVLTIFGPTGTIQKVSDRIRSYEFPFFPFQKIVLDLVEIEPTTLTRARLECTKRFPVPERITEPRAGRVVFATPRYAVEAVSVDHTVPCLAYALVEHSAFHVQLAALAEGALRPGGWIRDVARRLEAVGSPHETIEIQGLSITLEQLATRYFRRTAGGRMAFVTDTLWSPAVRAELIGLCLHADRLYCDCFYAAAQAAAARKHKHMTTESTAELAIAAKVGELVLMHFSQRYQSRYDALVDEVRARFPRVSAQIS